MGFALTGARIFDGEVFHDHKAVVVEDRYIVGIVSDGAIPKGYTKIALEGGLLAPGFVDVQVNGGGGALLNDGPSVEVVRQIATSHRRHGTTGLLPTVITDAPEVMSAAITAVRDARDTGLAAVLGIHVEGPFLDVARKGAHAAQFIRILTGTDVQLLGEANCGRLMLTLAPNCVSSNHIEQLVRAGILVSLGHSDANFEVANAALVAGATSFTHLFNAMSQFTGREPGMVGAALADTKSYIGVIADGHHVHDAALKFAFASTASDRFMLITDAMPSAAGGPISFALQGRKVSCIDDKLVLEDGTLAGSNLTMDVALRNCVNRLGVELAAALRMASTNPARFLGLQNQLGIAAPGALASLVHLDAELNVTRTWIEGQ